MSDSRDFVNTVKMDVFADEVFVFTPRGDVIDLPVGAVPIDFCVPYPYGCWQPLCRR